MWLRSEKRERHLLTTAIGSSRSNRGAIKRTAACAGQRTSAWKQAIKRDVVRNNLKNLTNIESLPIQPGKNVLQTLKKCGDPLNGQAERVAALSKTTKSPTFAALQKSVATVATRESVRQAKMTDKLSSLHVKTFVNKNKTRKKPVETEKITTAKAIDGKHSDTKLTNGDAAAANGNLSPTRMVKGPNGCSSSPRKSIRLEKSEKLSVVNNSPSRKARQMPRRSINQIVSINSCLVSKCHKTVKPAVASPPTIKDKSVQVPSAEAFANDWSTIVDQEMTMYEKDSDKFNPSNEESDTEAAIDHSFSAPNCLSEERLNTFVSIPDVESLTQTKIIEESLELCSERRCSSLDRKSVTDKNKNLRDKRSSSLRKEYGETKPVKRRSSAIEFHRSCSAVKTEISLRRLSCDKNWKKSETDATSEKTNKTYSKLRAKTTIAYNTQEKVPRSDDILQNNQVKELRGIIANCEEALQSFDQPDFISIFNDAIEASRTIDEQTASWQTSTFSEEEELAFANLKQDGMQLSTRSAIERLEALSDLQLQPTSFLADISQSLAATEDGWVSVV